MQGDSKRGLGSVRGGRGRGLLKVGGSRSPGRVSNARLSGRARETGRRGLRGSRRKKTLNHSNLWTAVKTDGVVLS